MLFAGPPGVGKTTTAEAIVNEIFQAVDRTTNVKRLNASDDRGIGVVREDIKNFARVLPSGSVTFKIIILDEADQMTSEAQHALRRTMEQYNALTRFILICNYSSKIIPPIQSRCAIFRFRGLEKEEIMARLRFIAIKKQLTIDDEALEALYDSSEGDMRQAINALQAASVLDTKITLKTIQTVQGYVKPDQVRKVILEVIKPHPDFLTARKHLRELMEAYGLSGQDLVKHLNRELAQIPNEKLSDTARFTALSMLSEVDYRLSVGCNPQVQFDAFLAKFIVAAQNK
jgi:replication factor C small subunit